MIFANFSDPENPVRRAQLWPPLARFPHPELLPKRKVLQRQLAVRANRVSQCLKEDSNHRTMTGEIADRVYASGGVERRLADIERRLSALEQQE